MIVKAGYNHTLTQGLTLKTLVESAGTQRAMIALPNNIAILEEATFATILKPLSDDVVMVADSPWRLSSAGMPDS